MFSIHLITGVVLAFSTPAKAGDSADSHPSPEDAVHAFQDKYGLSDVDEKRVDNRGQGYEALYGTRNFRMVLNGLVYRGGANNKYHRTNPRSNSNPLPSDGLRNLCEEGFGEAVYLYSTNYSSSAKSVNCSKTAGGSNTLRYLQASVLSSIEARDRVVELIHKKLVSGDAEPVYLHCWNGWHASGYISAIVLRQFCGWSGSAAVSYWNRNTDGNDGSEYESIRKKIRDYSPKSEWTIGSALKKQVCPVP